MVFAQVSRSRGVAFGILCFRLVCLGYVWLCKFLPLGKQQNDHMLTVLCDDTGNKVGQPLKAAVTNIFARPIARIHDYMYGTLKREDEGNGPIT